MNQQSTSRTSLCRKHILAQGQVQGVGFRPFIYRLALEFTLTGHVNNTAAGVHIEVQGAWHAVEAFTEAVQKRLPPLAVLSHFTVSELAPLGGEESFSIIHSAAPQQQGHSVLISSDMALCADCEQDMQDPSNARYLYPFTNCTNCGPRYTITKSIPYDRATTSMACFALCPSCQEEYDNPLDRRFHAQPNACPTCGPRLWFVDKNTLKDNKFSPPNFATHKAEHSQQALQALVQALLQGKIAAMKGLGGFHLTCHALHKEAIVNLRKHKNRPHKPFAIMVADMASAHAVAFISPEEEALLHSQEKPIVLCTRKSILPEILAPDTDTVGIILPYTPLHKALFMHLEKAQQQQQCEKKLAPLALVMTSGNMGGEPICLGNREAATRLASLAEVFLFHDRDILVRNDDSVCAVHSMYGHIDQSQKTERTIFYRRARGYVPRPTPLPKLSNAATLPTVLGMGAELKSTLCLTRQHTAFVSQHIGDLQNLETLHFYRQVLHHLEKLLQVQPACIVHDAHPDFLSTRVAQELAQERGITNLSLQHHYAHAYAIMAEHGLTSPCLALSLDGTGFGDDGSIWGGELLYIDGVQHKRLGRLSPFALAGGEQAIREPWRIAVALAQNSSWQEQLNTIHPMSGAVCEMINKNIRSPLCSSAGRLFDAVAAALDLCHTTTYEGQAAIRLEQAQKAYALQCASLHSLEHFSPDHVPQKVDTLWELSSAKLFTQALSDAEKHDVTAAAYNFHANLAHGFTLMAAEAAKHTSCRSITLSGGVMHNATFAALLNTFLMNHGFTVYNAKHMPPGDGGISLGQVFYGCLHMLRC